MHANINIVGRLTDDPDLHERDGGGDFVTFDVAVNRYDYQEGDRVTDYYEVITFSRTDSIMNNIHKGTTVAIAGEHRIRTYEDRDGIERQSNQIGASEINFIDNFGKDSFDGNDEFDDDEFEDDEFEDDEFDDFGDLDDMDFDDDEDDGDVPF